MPAGLARPCDRQVAVLPRADWRGWIDGSVPAQQLLRPSPAGTFRVERTG
jgi:putative SOS response-associated peptidase YedK